MEPLFEHSVYFPAAGELVDPAECDTLRQRTHFYLGETVHFLVVLRKGSLLRAKQMGDLFAVATVGALLDDSLIDPNNNAEEETEAKEDQPGDILLEHHRRRSIGATHKFVECRPLLNHNNARHRMEPVKIVVSVWEQDEDQMEVKEHGYLGVLRLCSPARTFREDLNKFKAQVSATLNVLPPPSVGCQHLTVSGKHLTFLKVLNGTSCEELCITDVRILPNYNSSYLPMMPDGSVLVVDNVCHRSAEVTMASFYRVDTECSLLPSTLGSLEEHNFLFRLQLQDKEDHDSSEGLEIPLVAVLQWHTSSPPRTRHIATFYSLPSISLNRPRLVMIASCPRVVRPRQSFPVKYTLVNNLRDFLSVRLRWNFQAHAGGGSHRDREVTAVVCQSPFSNLGCSKKGSNISFTVAFQILETGLFELSQHMKMKLQFTSPLEEPRSPQRCTQASVDNVKRSLSFSQQPHLPRPHHVRTGSMVERPFATTPEQSLVSPDQVAKRQCQVFVLEHIGS
ncbi:microtubule-associated protein 11 isoform X2 [Syngnathus acus]|uniref:microtubule-associated protein 11 isoform X2 n=1 Tax=Syngnathus acus TaxID=161584 RepID=UPI0018863533|nr:microtubule-associated protein 11 isoform X2 [Syngnathus acus]